MSRAAAESLQTRKRKRRLRRNLIIVGSILGVFSVLLALYIYNLHMRDDVPPLIVPNDAADSAAAVVHFIDVGQADAACIVLASGETVLIDAGSNASENKLLAYLSKYNVKRIDYAVFTHPHEDHIGGADAVFDACDVMHVIMPLTASATSTFDILLDKIEEEKCGIIPAEIGNVYTVGNAVLTVLGPAANDTETDNLNNVSILLRVDCGNTSFLFTGDTETDAEMSALRMLNADLFDADVLKVGHHGSSTSSSNEFLAAVTPDVAVISCGEQNEYGHPHQAVIDRLQVYTGYIYRTDQSGSVRVYTDGETLYVRCDRKTDT